MKNKDIRSEDKINTGWYTYSYRLSKNDRDVFNIDVKKWCEINSLNYKNPKCILAEKIVGFSKIDLLLSLQSSYLNVSEEKAVIVRKMNDFLNAFIKGIRYGIECNAVKNVKLFLPFIRLSLISYSLLYTQFILIDYFDDHSEFIVFEEIPDYNEITKNIETVREYSKSAILSVRNSFFSHEYYKYIGHTIAKDSIICNYILSNFVKINFYIDLESLEKRLFISSNNDLTCQINKDKKVQFSGEEKGYRVAVGFKHKYSDYFKTAVEATLFYIIYIYVEGYLTNLSKSKSTLLTQQERIFRKTALSSIKRLRKFRHIVPKFEITEMLKENKHKNFSEAYGVLLKPFCSAYIDKMLEP